MRRFRLLGLRWGRWTRWWAVIRDEGHRPTLKDWAKMAALVWRLAVSKPRSAEDRKRVRRCYAVCCRCNFQDRHLRTCIGCGCVMPIKLAAGGGCWAHEQDPATTIGFSSDAAP